MDNLNTYENEFNDGTIPEIVLPGKAWVTEPLPESDRPRKDGPGGEGNDQQ